MRNFLCGLIIGLTLAGTIAGAGGLYDKQGRSSAPYASPEYFNQQREFMQQMDIEAMRKEMDRRRIDQQLNPCAK